MYKRRCSCGFLPIEKRAQGTIEFIVLFSAALGFLVVFIGIIQLNIANSNIEKQRVFAQSVAISVRDEIGFAQESSDGYVREFFIPENVLGATYNVTLIDDSVYCSIGNYSVLYQSFPVVGNINFGTNVIRKDGGVIYVNS